METPLNPAGRHITGRVKSEVRVADGREVLAGTNATANAVDVAINSTRYTDIGKQKISGKKKAIFRFSLSVTTVTLGSRLFFILLQINLTWIANKLEKNKLTYITLDSSTLALVSHRTDSFVDFACSSRFLDL